MSDFCISLSVSVPSTCTRTAVQWIKTLKISQLLAQGNLLSCTLLHGAAREIRCSVFNVEAVVLEASIGRIKQYWARTGAALERTGSDWTQMGGIERRAPWSCMSGRRVDQ